MAFDIDKTREIIQTLRDLSDSILPKSLDEATKMYIHEKIFGPAFNEIENFLDESRPPVIFMMGRSGHGKSSIINAISGKRIAEISSVKPGTVETTRYEIDFAEAKSSWTFYDSRGYFETCSDKSENSDLAKNLLKRSISECKPDVILHVISITEVRNLSGDIKFYNEVSQELHKENGASSPTLIVLNNSDLLGNPHEWPPEENAIKSGLIKEEIDYLSKDILNIHNQNPLKNSNSLYGITVKHKNYLGIIPTCGLWNDSVDDRWNIESLIDYIGKILPKDALLFYSQAIKRNFLLKKISNDLIKRFTGIASTIGSTPIPIGDIFILTPLQLLLVAVIAVLSGRDVNKNNYKKIIAEFSSATGLVIGTALGLREFARVILDATGVGIPVAAAISGAIAGAGTYTAGKLAEAYFFDNEIKDPKALYEEGNNFINQ